MSGDQELPSVARLYYTGIGHRRYKRASVRNGPGEPLCFVSVAEYALRRERAKIAQLIAAIDQAKPYLDGAHGKDRVFTEQLLSVRASVGGAA